VFEHIVLALVHGSGYERIASPGRTRSRCASPFAIWSPGRPNTGYIIQSEAIGDQEAYSKGL
jgi:hypothetical protein